MGSSRRRNPSALGTLCPLVLAACTGFGAVDGGAGAQQAEAAPVMDSGPASVPDSGAPGGIGSADGGVATDAGLDSGEEPPIDAGASEDAGPLPAPVAWPAVPCQELADPDASDAWSVDPTPVTLPQDLGRLVRCAHVSSVDPLEAAVLASPYLLGGITAQNGYEQYLIQYITQGPPGVVRHVSALVDVPDTGAQGMTLVAVAHATNGIAPICGVTHQTVFADYMALPAVVGGYAMVATDYQGMGVDDRLGTTYAIGPAEAAAVDDSITAVGQLHDPGRFDASQLSRQVFLMGHSQGGQAALWAEQEFDPDGGFTLLGTVAFAPAFGDLRGLEHLTEFLDAGTVDDDYILTLTLYAHSQYGGNPPLGEWLTPAAEAQLPALLDAHCLILGQADYLYRFPTVGSVFNADFARDFASCALDGGACPALDPLGSALMRSVPGSFSSSAPVLLLQGEADTTVLPETTACIQARLDAHGTPEQTCAYPGLDHLSLMLPSTVADALTWMAGILDGGTPPSVCQAALEETCLPDGSPGF